MNGSGRLRPFGRSNNRELYVTLSVSREEKTRDARTLLPFAFQEPTLITFAAEHHRQAGSLRLLRTEEDRITFQSRSRIENDALQTTVASLHAKNPVGS